VIVQTMEVSANDRGNLLDEAEVQSPDIEGILTEAGAETETETIEGEEIALQVTVEGGILQAEEVKEMETEMTTAAQAQVIEVIEKMTHAIEEITNPLMKKSL
jgi:hypothetical protein